MWKKITALIMAFTLVFAVASVQTVDAKGYKAPAKSYNPGAGKSGVTNGPASTTTKTPAAGTAAKTGGFFSGGSFLKGMMIGGLAGMLFGGMFGGMGFFGNILGLMVNLLAIFVVIVLIMKVVELFRKRRKPEEKRY